MQALYFALLRQFGAEFTILRELDPKELNRVSPLLSEAIKRLREGEVSRHGGYDGAYGRISLFTLDQLAKESAAIKDLEQKIKQLGHASLSL